jgi:hypothetical protein
MNRGGVAGKPERMGDRRRNFGPQGRSGVVIEVCALAGRHGCRSSLTKILQLPLVAVLKHRNHICPTHPNGTAARRI